MAENIQLVTEVKESRRMQGRPQVELTLIIMENGVRVGTREPRSMSNVTEGLRAFYLQRSSSQMERDVWAPGGRS